MEAVKSILGGLAKGRRVKEIEEGYQLREPSVPYGDHFEAKKAWTLRFIPHFILS